MTELIQIFAISFGVCFVLWPFLVGGGALLGWLIDRWLDWGTNRMMKREWKEVKKRLGIQEDT